jgi:hypothetical protein
MRLRIGTHSACYLPVRRCRCSASLTTSHELADDGTVARQFRAPITHRAALAPGDRHRRMQVSLDSEFDVRCLQCGRMVSYSQRYDAYFCMPCDIWCEPTCAEPACTYCGARADRPDGLRGLDAARPTEAEHAPPINASSSAQRVETPAVRRNQPCGCGTGKKFKLCCGTRNGGQDVPHEAPPSNTHFLARLSRLLR